MNVQKIALANIAEKAIVYNPRASMGDLKDLADDISRNGLLQPIVVMSEGPVYHIIAGFRRVAAIRQFIPGMREIPANVVGTRKDVTPEAMAKINASENLKRRNLSTYEQAMLFRHVKQTFNVKAQDVGKFLGIPDGAPEMPSVSHVNNMTRLLDRLDKPILDAWEKGHEDASIPALLSIVTHPTVKDEAHPELTTQVEEWTKHVKSQEALRAPEEDATAVGEGGTSKPKRAKKSRIGAMASEVRKYIKANPKDEQAKGALEALMWADKKKDSIPWVIKADDDK